MTTGIRSRVPAAEYFALPGLSISRLKEMRHSPQMYLYRMQYTKETDAMRLGTAAHTAVLEPERFAHEFAAWERRTEAGATSPRRGKAWDDFEEMAAGKTVITSKQYDLAMAIAAAVHADPKAARYLEVGDPEVTMEWELGGRMCRGRVDWLTALGRVAPDFIVGLKTARDCRHYQFGAAAAKLGYHLQWAYYFDGYKAITGRSAKLVEIVVESAPPHCVAVYPIPEDVIEQGREEYEYFLKRLGECEATGCFPGPQEQEELLSLPSYVYERQDDITELGLET